MPDGFGEASFNGVPMHIYESSPGFFPEAAREAYREITHIPYSDDNIVDHGGRGEWHFNARVKVFTEDVPDFQNAEGILGDFILYGLNRGTGDLAIKSTEIYAGLTFYVFEIEIIY